MVEHDVKYQFFYGENYNLWKFRMEGYLISLGVDLFSTVVFGYVVPNILHLDLDENKRYQNNTKAKNAVTVALSENELIKLRINMKLIRKKRKKISKPIGRCLRAGKLRKMKLL